MFDNTGLPPTPAAHRPLSRQLSSSGKRDPVTRPLWGVPPRPWGSNHVKDLRGDPPDLSNPSMESPERPNDAAMNGESEYSLELEIWFHMRYHTFTWGRSGMAKAYQVRQLLLALEELGIL